MPKVFSTPLSDQIEAIRRIRDKYEKLYNEAQPYSEVERAACGEFEALTDALNTLEELQRLAK